MSESLRSIALPTPAAAPRRQDAPTPSGEAGPGSVGDRGPAGRRARPGPAMRADVFVYISGPIAPRDGFTLEQNVAAGVQVFLELTARGIPAFCPHLCGTFDAVAYEQWLAYDLAVLARCTHILLLPRWWRSPGALAEVHTALVRDLTVLTDISQLDGPP